MSLPQYNNVTKQNTSNVERATFSQAKSTAEAAKKSAAITNKELKKLNDTTQQIADATAALVVIQSQALEESGRQTAILDAQLQIAQISELKKSRQNQIKQAGFSVEQKIEDIEKIQSHFSKYFQLKDQKNQIDIVGLVADELNEIDDKKYVLGVLTKLSNALNSARLNLAQQEVIDVDTYFTYKFNLFESLSLKDRLVLESVSLFVPKVPNLLVSASIAAFAPSRFSPDDKKNKYAKIAYYVFALVTYGIGFLAGAIRYYLEWKIINENNKNSKELLDKLAIDIANTDEEISRLNNFFEQFEKKYSHSL